ncbi:MAG TPA: DUF58 domain-containing protein [Steroidobacteraceae bacterium]|nr:DUF58 domain-containing protein [Steroidobacteraceae bacterium]
MNAWLRGRMARWIRQRQGPDALPLTLERRRLYILPTRAGVGFGLLLLLMLVAGLNYANSVALFLTFLLMGFGLVVMHQCHRNLLGARLLAASTQPAFARGVGLLDLTFDNPAGPARYRVLASLPDAAPMSADLPPQGREQIELTVDAPRRGRMRIDRLKLVTRHPFGLFRTWTWVHAPLELLVYPRPHGSLPMPGFGGTDGVRATSSPGWDEWLGLRPFRHGDSPRQVDWKAYAREAPLLVKEYGAAGSEMRWFDYDALGALSAEARLEQLARWVVDAEAAGELYGLTLPGQRIDPSRGAEHCHRCLGALAVFGLE